MIKNENIDDLEKKSANKAFNTLHDVVTKNIEKSQYIASKRQNPRNPWISKSTINEGILVERLRKKIYQESDKRK